MNVTIVSRILVHQIRHIGLGAHVHYHYSFQLHFAFRIKVALNSNLGIAFFLYLYSKHGVSTFRSIKSMGDIVAVLFLLEINQAGYNVSSNFFLILTVLFAGSPDEGRLTWSSRAS